MKTIICETCSQPFEIPKSRYGIAKYCSMVCRGKALLGKPPANKGVFTNRVILKCEHCGKEFSRIASRLKYGRGKHCSPECQYAAIKQRPKNNTQFFCLNCHKAFYLTKSKANSHKGAGKYCSRTCRDTHRIKQNHPDFINGDRSNWHGPNWYSQRRKVLKRDNNTCQCCKITKEESYLKFGQRLVVHHIIPFRMFEGDYKSGNQLRNLVTLCHSCHRTIESRVKNLRP